MFSPSTYLFTEITKAQFFGGCPLGLPLLVWFRNLTSIYRSHIYILFCIDIIFKWLSAPGRRSVTSWRTPRSTQSPSSVDFSLMSFFPVWLSYNESLFFPYQNSISAKSANVQLTYTLQALNSPIPKINKRNCTFYPLLGSLPLSVISRSGQAPTAPASARFDLSLLTTRALCFTRELSLKRLAWNEDLLDTEQILNNRFSSTHFVDYHYERHASCRESRTRFETFLFSLRRWVVR